MDSTFRLQKSHPSVSDVACCLVIRKVTVFWLLPIWTVRSIVPAFGTGFLLSFWMITLSSRGRIFSTSSGGSSFISMKLEPAPVLRMALNRRVFLDVSPTLAYTLKFRLVRIYTLSGSLRFMNRYHGRWSRPLIGANGTWRG